MAIESGCPAPQVRKAVNKGGILYDAADDLKAAMSIQNVNPKLTMPCIHCKITKPFVGAWS